MAARVRFRSLRLRMVLASALTLAAPLVVVCVGGVTMYGEVDSRETLAQLSLALLPMAIGLALFLGWRMSRPIDSLKRQLTDRASDAACREPVALERDDEFGDLADAVNQLLGALDARSREKEAFVADLAHELKGPVAAVRAAAEGLARGEAVAPERAERLGRVLLQSSRALDGSISRFLELANAEAGLPQATRQRVDLRALLLGLVRAAQADPRFDGVRFETRLARISVDGAGERLESACRNLLENAASFAGEGGRVRVGLEQREGRALVKVTDTGPGIATCDLPRVFDRFFTRRASGDGTGLGLALTRAIVHAHGGTIRVASSPGKGATFEVSLP